MISRITELKPLFAQLSPRLIKARFQAMSSQLTAEPFGIYRLQGTLGDSKHPASMLFVGSEIQAGHMSSLLFNGQASPRILAQESRLLPSERYQAFQTKADDLVVHELLPWELAKDVNRFIFQCYTNSYLNIQGDFATHLKNAVSENAQRTLKSANKAGYTLSVSHTLEDIECFYYDYQLPFALANFGDNARVSDISWLLGMRSDPSSIKILFVEKDGRRIAGAALVSNNRESEMFVFGYGLLTELLEEQKVRREVMALLNARSLEMAFQNYATISLGLSSTLLFDGVFNYKRQWGFSFAPYAHRPHFSLRFLKENCRFDFFRHAPLFHVEQKALSGILSFVPETDSPEKELGTLLRRICYPGLRQLHVLVRSSSLCKELSANSTWGVTCSVTFEYVSDINPESKIECKTEAGTP